MEANEEKRITILEEAFKYVQAQLADIKGMIKSLATLRDIADMESKMKNLDARIIETEIRINKEMENLSNTTTKSIEEMRKQTEETRKQTTELMVKVAGIASIVTFITAIIVDLVIRK